MKLLAKQNRELIMVNAQNTQNENDAEKIILKVPEQYEDFNKKIVFVTPDGIVWDLIVNNEYLIKKAITKYKQVDFYIWLTKGDVDFRSQTRTLKFYHNVDASGEITPEEISGVNTVVNLLEEEITKVNNLETEIDGKLEEVDTAIENIHTAIQETENLDLDAEKVGQTTTITLTKKDGTVKTVHVDDGYDDTELKNDISSINANIKANYYNKADTDTKLDTKANTSDVYTKTETDTRLNAKANSSNVYTKTETDTKLNTKQEKLTAGTGIEITGENTINNIQGNYSTEETKIGTWIDGKPLYRKTFNITSEFSTSLNMPHNISNIDYCKCYGTLIKGNISVEQYYASSTDYFRCFREGYFVKIRYDTNNNPTAIIINLEYTKTTD